MPQVRGFALIDRVEALKRAYWLEQITPREFSRGIRQIWAQFPRMAR